MKVVENIIRAIAESEVNIFTKAEIIKLIKRETDIKVMPEITSNGIIISPETRTVIDTNTNKTHKFTKKEFDLLYYLMDNSNKNITRYEILRDVWGTDVIIGDRTIDVHIRKLRSVINPKFIRTDKGVGYKWDSRYFQRLERNTI